MTDRADLLGSPRRIHLVGVGGAGISAIAVILAQMGHRVTGSDLVETGNWPALRTAGVDVSVRPPDELFDAPSDVEILAHSSAFPPSDADRRRIADDVRILNRADILAAICARRPTVGIAGTHGKTSTTAMLATLLDGLGADPSFLVGSIPEPLGVAARWGSDRGLFVVEADESDGSFLELPITTAVVTNVDEDHLDHWGDLDAIDAAFDRYVAGAGRSVLCIDDPAGSGAADARALRIAGRHGSVTVGEAAEAEFRLHDIRVDRLETIFGLEMAGREIGPVRIGTPGRHHARNAAVALAVAITHGSAPDEAVDAIGRYRGVARRFTLVGEAAGVTVVDDYAHNPNKIRALLDSARAAGWDRVVVIFQPQRPTRIRDQGFDFGAALTGADLVAITDIYTAGEPDLPGVNGRIVLDALLEVRPFADVAWTPTLDDAATWAAHRVRSGDLVLTVGAGDVHRLGPDLLHRLEPGR